MAEGSGVIRVGLCQVYTQEWDVEGNTVRTLGAIREAADQGAHLVITPECVLHGYGFTTGELHAETRACAQRVDGPIIAGFRHLAADSRIHLMLGFCELAEDERLHNTAAMIRPDGSIAWLYRKVHCRPFEADWAGSVFTPGDRFYVETVEYDGHTACVGAMICFDREVVESTRCLRALGAQFIACPLATDTYSLSTLPPQADNEMVTRVRAAENEVYIAVVNHAGRFNGGTFVVGPHGEVLLQMGADAEVRVVDIPIEQVTAQYHAHPLGWMGWGYRRPEVYRPYLDPNAL